MGLTCSVLGHRYGERERIEEQDRQGSEEIIAIREVKTCERCGDELVVSESKEVLAVETEPSDLEPTPEPEPETENDDSVSESSPDLETDPDDGIIIVDDDEREPGEWPSMETEDSAETDDPTPADWPDVNLPAEEEDAEVTVDTTEWPEVSGEDEGFDAVVGEDDSDVSGAVIEAATPPASSGDQTEGGFIRAGPIDSPADPDEGDVHAEYFCPQCDWSAQSLTTSVRRGDICPECRTGYIAERKPS